MRRSIGRTIGFGLLAVAVVGFLAPAGAAEIDGAGGTGTITVKVKYFDDGLPSVSTDKTPLEGVEVFLWDGAAARYACTDANGVVVFEDVMANVNLRTATGPAVSEECSNPWFLNPDGGDKMLAVLYDKHHGVQEIDDFQISPGEELTIKLNAKTPNGQKKICFGMLATILGTGQPETINGTLGNDVIVGKGGADTIYGSSGDDIICGGKVGDTIYGENGNDRLFGELGADMIYGDSGDDVLYGGEKNDTLIGGTGTDELFGDAGNDTCISGEILDSCES